jgi:uncharacterized protein DUF6915
MFRLSAIECSSLSRQGRWQWSDRHSDLISITRSRITAHRYGGEWQDWIAIYDWIDRSKEIFPSMQHRMFLHSDLGEWLTALRVASRRRQIHHTAGSGGLSLAFL